MAQTESPKELPAALRNADNLPSLPAVAVEVLRLTQDDDSTLDDLAQVLSRDPALAAKLLKLSNSSMFGMGSEIATLQRASMVLGMKTVKLMSLSFSLVGAIPQSGSPAGFDLQEYWRRSLVGAVSARSLGKLVGSTKGDEAFLCGLLGHMGKLVLALCLPDEYAEVTAKAAGWPTTDLESSLLGFNGADVAQSLFKSWELPDILSLGVGYMHRSEVPDEVDEATQTFLRLMQASNLTQCVLCSADKGKALENLHTELRRSFELDESEVDAFLVGLEAGITETAELMNISLPNDVSHQEVLEQARMQMVNVSLGTAVDLNRAQRRTEELEDQNRELEGRALTDKLTGLANRAAFDDVLERQVQMRIRGGVPRALGVVMIDLDRFKSFNDTYGHQAGDEVLRMVGAVLTSTTRKGDVPVRYGGEEFALIAPQTTPFGLKTVCERLRAAIESQVLEYDGNELSVTASFGAACVARVASDKDGLKLVKLADRFLYKAKENGRNRCEVYPKMQFPRI